MPKCTSFIKVALLAAAASLSAAAASAQQEEFVVQVYEKGFLPNILYIGNGSVPITFKNMTNRTLGLDYSYGSIMVNSFGAGSTVTVSPSAMYNKRLKQPWVFGRGYLGSSAQFSIRNGQPPLQ